MIALLVLACALTCVSLFIVRSSRFVHVQPVLTDTGLYQKITASENGGVLSCTVTITIGKPNLRASLKCKHVLEASIS